jgi:predicted GH43/DUF377 family glycosyl hydrolase
MDTGDMATEDFLTELRTPNKSGSFVVKPSYRKGEFDSHAVDCPFLFFHDDRYWMTFVGWDGIGYRTGLASSENLESWKREGIILDRGPKGSATEFNAALTNILRDNELHGPGTLKKVNGHFVGTYHAYPKPGYESGPAVIGLCTSTDLRHWDVQPPILKPDPTCQWESGGLYKSWILEHEGTYFIFYNAKNTSGRPWIEQTGFARSNDLVHWERYENNPVLKLGPKGAFDDLFASDPCVLRHRDTWVMFYFGNSTDGHARDGVAVSNDLMNWEKVDEILLEVGPEGSIDSKYAHKPGIITRDGKLYHFYCAVYTAEDPHLGEIEHPQVRGISYASN